MGPAEKRQRDYDGGTILTDQTCAEPVHLAHPDAMVCGPLGHRTPASQHAAENA